MRTTRCNEKPTSCCEKQLRHSHLRNPCVSLWLAKARDGGPAALLSRPTPGHPAKLEPAQMRLIPDFLSHGAEAYGFRGEVWTCARVARVIEEEFGVTYCEPTADRSA